MTETERLREEKGFAELLRHELNNPLTGILGNAELLLAEVGREHLELPARTRTRLETIAALAVRMRETVRRLSEECELQAAGPAPGAPAKRPSQPSA